MKLGIARTATKKFGTTQQNALHVGTGYTMALDTKTKQFGTSKTSS
jgi:hypothetical protein|tara:strand:+ start:4107 stop:4244 length:138 start_codon:yes stop_codon:yes gene_type:complete